MALELYAYHGHAAVVKYTGEDKYVVIPQQYNGVPVTEINANVFAHNTAIELVFVPSTLRAIGVNAFANCPNLKYIGTGLKNAAFHDIPALPEDQRPKLNALSDEDIPVLSHIPAGVQVVSDCAFAKSGIQNIEFMSESICLGDAVFEGCPRLKLAAFYNCTHLTLGTRVFTSSAISRFYAPKMRFDMIPDYSFADCKHLVRVATRIYAVGVRAFYHCEKLESLDVPKELLSVGKEAFDGCFRLKGIHLPKKNPPEKPKPLPELFDWLRLPDRHGVWPDEDSDNLLIPITDDLNPSEFTQEETMATNETRTDLGQPLFSMRIDSLGMSVKKLPTKIRGCLRQNGNAFHFVIHTPASLSEANLRTLPSPGLTNLTPLLKHIAKNDMTVDLYGKQNDTTYTIYEILPVALLPGKGSASDFFREMCKRLMHPAAEEVDLNAMVPPFSMRTEEEYETFLEVCGSRLPAWVLKAYNKNQETLRRRNNRMSDDECKHARLAQELLMNIDWYPNVVNVPSAEATRKALDQEFFGLEAVKERLAEVVSQIRRSGKLPKWGILLHGPAGTGKTAIAKAVAKIFNMPLIRMDLFDLSDDPQEIDGSSRIYSNARPGHLLETMFQNRSSTAVLLVNEVDKAGEGKGGKSAADMLLSILDKTGFPEKCLEETIPTDNLFCIGTCNDLSKISKPLQDRFLIIDVPAYTPSEKKVIFSDYVFPRATADANIPPDRITLEEEAVDLLISEYALEPGARDLEQFAERLIGNYCLYTEGEAGTDAKRVYTPEDIRNLLGPGHTILRQFAINPGEVNAAFYHEGRAQFFLVEASVVPGTGNFKVLGPMAKLQEEYCEVAYHCVRNTISKSAWDFTQHDVTVFIPQPIPDGIENHVGLACYAAICSKLMNTNLAINDICFIGGCDLNGSLYFDENDLTPLLRSMKTRGVSTLYAPMGTNRLVNANVNKDCNVIIVEAPDAKTLFSLAMAQSNRKY